MSNNPYGGVKLKKSGRKMTVDTKGISHKKLSNEKRKLEPFDQVVLNVNNPSIKEGSSSSQSGTSLRKRRGGSVAERVGHAMGKKQIFCCLRHWILISLTIFALLGTFLAIILYTWPCESALVPSKLNILDQIEVIPVIDKTVCKTSTGAIAMPICAKNGHKLVNLTTCDKISCEDETGAIIFDKDKCKKACGEEKCVGGYSKRETDEQEFCNLFIKKCTQTRKQTCTSKQVCVPIGATNITDNDVDTPVCKNETSQADFDGLLLLDYSGSLAPNFETNGANNYFTESVDIVTGHIIPPFNNALGGSTNAKFQMGAVAWSSSLQSDKQVGLTECVVGTCSAGTSLNGSLNSWRSATPAGGTAFIPPLRWCKSEMAASGSIASNGVKACFLISDGENNNENKINSYAEAKDVISSTNVSIVGVYIDRSTTVSATNAKNLYCHSSCNTNFTRTAVECIAATTDNDMDNCPYFLRGSFQALAALNTKLDTLVDGIIQQVAVTSSNSKSEAASTQLASVFNQTDAEIKGVEILEGCRDPTHFWLLVFFIPLAVYLLYYPCKRRMDARKDYLRGLLEAKRRLLEKKEVVRNSQMGEMQFPKENETMETTDNAKLVDQEEGKKKKYKWDISANEHYIWASHTHGGILKVDFGKDKAPPPSAPRHENKKHLVYHDGTIVKEEDILKALSEIEQATTEEERARLEKELKEAEELEKSGGLKEDGAFWLRICTCCQGEFEEEDDD